MKNLLLAGIVTATLSSFSFFNDPLAIGSDMPKADIKMKDISGSLVSLKDAKTPNGLLVMFTCNTCPYVIKNQGRTKDICHYAQDKKLGVILLNSNEGGRRSGDSYSDMQTYAKEQGYRWYYAMDSDNELADAFGASRTPECYLFNKEGKLVYHGAIDDSPADITSVHRTHLKDAIIEMLSDKDISVKESRSVGCSIKRKG
ncbi:MAG TPA: thioredoxin family protein [Chitinophagaceae bacterium]|jgi:thioredoxin-related protein